MLKNEKYIALTEAAICSFALMIFSFFIHSEFPLRFLSLSALVLVSYFFSRQLIILLASWKNSSIPLTFSFPLLFTLTGTVSGILLAIFYRWYLGISLLPRELHCFVIIAALTGATEELVFRGLIQHQVKNINGPFSVLFSTLSHTGYKCCLFLAPGAGSVINISVLAFWTFLAGLLFGSIRHFSKSIVPVIIGHALFDILVYAEFVKAPWWVW